MGKSRGPRAAKLETLKQALISVTQTRLSGHRFNYADMLVQGSGIIISCRIPNLTQIGKLLQRHALVDLARVVANLGLQQMRATPARQHYSPVLGLRWDAIASSKGVPTLRTSRARRGVDQKVRGSTQAGTRRCGQDHWKPERGLSALGPDDRHHRQHSVGYLALRQLTPYCFTLLE